ncbi:uncharacterized protein [Musca autumnalis]|uniref:uncharacterized protein n=1 Tax=Musca autumnalis TaxID=221902 RepID=UPI003CE7B6D6
MIHHDQILHDSSRENVVKDSGHEEDVTLTDDVVCEVVPFYQQLTTYKGARPPNYVSPNAMPTEIEPVLQCTLGAGGKKKLVTLLFWPEVPKSWVLYDSVKELVPHTPLSGVVSYGKFEVYTPEGTIKERFVLLDSAPFYIAPPINRPQFTIHASGRPIAHGQPFSYGQVDGVIGKDLEEQIARGPWEKSKRNPNVLMRNSVFGVIFGGSCARSNIPFLKSLSPLVPHDHFPA